MQLAMQFELPGDFIGGIDKAKLVDAPILAAFMIPSEDLGFAHGTKFSDPDLRAWECLGQGGTAQAGVEWLI